MTRPRPKKGRRPKCPTGVVPRWRAKFGWGFRAKRMIDGELVWGEIRSTKQEAAQDWIEIGQRAADIEDVKELLTFDGAMKLMLAETDAVGCRPATLRHYKEKLRPLWRHFRDMPLHGITRAHVEDYRDMRLKTPTRIKTCRCKNRVTCKHEGRLTHASPATVNKELQVLNRVFQVAIDKDRLPGQNPVRKVRRLKTQGREAHHYRASEVVEILAAIRACATRCCTARRFHNVVVVLFASGMRVGELAHLKVEHVDLRRGVLNVPKEGKTGHRAIPMPPDGPLLTVLSRMVQRRSRNEYVIGGPPDLTVSDIKSNLFKRWRRKLPEHLQKGFHAHTFRHSFTTHLGANDVPEHRIRALTGHKARSVSQRYLHPSEIELRRDMQRAFGALTTDLLGDWGPDAIAAAK